MDPDYAVRFTLLARAVGKILQALTKNYIAVLITT